MPLRIGPASDATSWVLSRREAAPAAGRPRRCTNPSSTKGWGWSHSGPGGMGRFRRCRPTGWYAVCSLGRGVAELDAPLLGHLPTLDLAGRKGARSLRDFAGAAAVVGA